MYVSACVIVCAHVCVCVGVYAFVCMVRSYVYLCACVCVRSCRVCVRARAPARVYGCDVV